tara:strand:+ start:1339 stop:1731 length:393 start_codon:yes stop_codon:yes gene_type:complete
MKKIILSIAILTLGLTGYSQVQIGNDIDGENTNDFSGHTVATSANGTIVAIGAIENDDGGNRSGHVRVYENVGGTWTKIGEDIAKEYYVSGTPTMFLLDNNRKILLRPNSVKQMDAWVDLYLVKGNPLPQ